jgi:hypothetical protein
MHDLVQRLSLDLQLPDLMLPASGVRAFTLDSVTVTINLHRSSDAFTVRSLVAQLTDSDLVVKAQRLLAANLVTGPCYFSVDSNGAVYATQYFRLATLSYGRFIQSLERFIDVVERWQRLLAPAEQESAA